MNKLQGKILAFFDNRQLLKNIRTSSVLALLVAIPLLWFGFKDTFDFGSLWSWNFASVIVVVTISVLIATKETKTRAFDDRFLLDKELEDLQKDIEENSSIINKKDRRMKKSRNWINEYNKDQQEMYNVILTNNTIEVLEKRVRRLRIKGKDKRASSIEKHIDELKQDTLFDKHFEHYDLNLLVNINKLSTKNKKKKGNKEINDKPKSINIILAIFGIPLRAAGVGVAGTIPFMINESWKTVALFYVTYLLTLIFTIVTQYLLTTYRMDNSYKYALRKTKSLQELLIEHLDKPEIEEVKEVKAIVPIEETIWFPKPQGLELAK
jgi:hypothetical protein